MTAADLSPVGDGRPFRVLSIDGGGIRGIVPTIVIAEIERRTGQSASRLFDLIAVPAVRPRRPPLRSSCPAAAQPSSPHKFSFSGRKP